MTEPTAKLSVANYLQYGIGQVGNQLIRDVPTAMLLFYMTNALLIPPGYAGFAILLPKVWVIVADPLVGMLSDRTQGRWGARKPFLLAGSLLSTVAFLLLFMLPVPSSPVLATVVIGFLYLILSTGYSLYSVPYLTLASEISDKPGERTTALAYKQIFALVGVGAGLSAAPWIIGHFGAGLPAYRIMAVVLGVVLLTTTMATTIFMPVGRAESTQPKIQGNLLRQVIEAFKHRPFKIVFFASTLQLLGFGIAQGGGLYFLVYIMRMPLTIMGMTVLMSVIGAVASQALWVKLAGRIGTIPCYMVATLASAVTGVMVLAIPAGDVPPYLVVGLVGGATTCGFTFMSFSALVEAIAQDGPDSSRKGLFAAAYTAMEKAMMAVGGFVFAIALAVSRFDQAAGPDGQTPFTLQAIIFTFVFIPTLLRLSSVVVLSRHNKVPRTDATLSQVEAAE